MREPNYPFYWLGIAGFSCGILFSIYLIVIDFVELKQFDKSKKYVTGRIEKISNILSAGDEITIAEISINDSLSIKKRVFENQFRRGDNINLIYSYSANSYRINTFWGHYGDLMISIIFITIWSVGLILIVKNKKWILKQRATYWPYG